MKLNVCNTATSYIYGNYKVLTAMLFIFVAGVSAGVFTEIQLPFNAKENMQFFLTSSFDGIEYYSDALSKTFLKSVAINGGLFLIIALLGISVIGFPLVLIALFYKGATLGFSAAFLMDTLSGKGINLVFLRLLPPNLVLIPALCLAAAASSKLTFNILTDGSLRNRNILKRKIITYVLFQTVMGALVMGSCFIEAFISPLLQPL